MTFELDEGAFGEADALDDGADGEAVTSDMLMSTEVSGVCRDEGDRYIRIRSELERYEKFALKIFSKKYKP
jgi:hypothetical protein